MAEKTDKPVDSIGLAAVGFAVFAVVLVVAFLSYRGSDVGQLPNLLGNLGGGPLAGFEGIRDSIAGSIAAGMIGSRGLGSVALLRVLSRSKRVLTIRTFSS